MGKSRPLIKMQMEDEIIQVLHKYCIGKTIYPVYLVDIFNAIIFPVSHIWEMTMILLLMLI